MLDWLIEKGTLIDGSRDARPMQIDVGIRDGRITLVDPGEKAEARNRVNASGMVIAPGFIDVHTHDDLAVIRAPESTPKISQGVTTVIVGNCGISAYPVPTTPGKTAEPMNLLGDPSEFVYGDFDEYRRAVNAISPSVNVAALTGHTTLRSRFMVDGDLNRPASPREIDAMCEALETCLRHGSIGLSSGLAYPNARNAPPEEIDALLGVVRSHSGIYTTHLRNEFEGILTAMDEAFRASERAGVPLVISHHKTAGRSNWGRTAETIETMEKASRRISVACDCYPYTASSSNLDPDQVDERIRIFITWSEPHPEMAGRTLEEISVQWGLPQRQCALRLMPAGAIYHCMHEEDVKRVLQWRRTMIGSDGLPCDPFPHPRLYGTFPRVIGRLSRDQNLYSMPEAIHRCTGLAAEVFGLAGRGLLREGYAADIVILDPLTILDEATFDDPRRLASGIRQVWVNGTPSFSPDNIESGRSGQLLARGTPEFR